MSDPKYIDQEELHTIASDRMRHALSMIDIEGLDLEQRLRCNELAAQWAKVVAHANSLKLATQIADKQAEVAATMLADIQGD